MADDIERRDSALPRIEPQDAPVARIDPELVAERLGAERAAAGTGRPGSPPALLALRQELARRLVSTGGRPRLTGTQRRQKIPLADEDWQALEKLAEGLADDDIRPSPGQVASVLLHQALEGTIDEAELRKSVRRQSRAGEDAS